VPVRRTRPEPPSYRFAPRCGHRAPVTTGRDVRSRARLHNRKQSAPCADAARTASRCADGRPAAWRTGAGPADPARASRLSLRTPLRTPRPVTTGRDVRKWARPHNRKQSAPRGDVARTASRCADGRPAAWRTGAGQADPARASRLSLRTPLRTPRPVTTGRDVHSRARLHNPKQSAPRGDVAWTVSRCANARPARLEDRCRSDGPGPGLPAIASHPVADTAPPHDGARRSQPGATAQPKAVRTTR